MVSLERPTVPDKVKGQSAHWHQVLAWCGKAMTSGETDLYGCGLALMAHSAYKEERESGWMAYFLQKAKNKPEQSGLCSGVVPLTGIEPVRCRHRGILSPLRLPIPPQRHKSCLPLMINDCRLIVKPLKQFRAWLYACRKRVVNAGIPVHLEGINLGYRTFI